jgi:hypothetical protein
MVKKTLKMPIKNIDDCVTQRCTLCVDQYRLADMQAVFAQKINWKEYDHANGVITGITNKECDAALVEERYYRMKDELHHPDLVFVGQSVLSYFVGWPATDEVRSTISYLMNGIEGGADAQAYKEIEGRYFPAMMMDPFRDPMKQPEGEDAEQFGIDSMVGVLIMSGFLLGLSILMVLMKLVCNQIKARRRKSEKESNEDGKEVADEEGGQKN